MKKTALVIIVAAVALVAGTAFAQKGWGPGMGCMGPYGYGTDKSVNVESVKKFRKETLSLRDDLVTKKIELRNEYGKETPDTTRIAEIQKQIIDTQAQIRKVAEKNGLPVLGQGPGRGGMGCGSSCGSAPCGCAQ